MTEHTTPDTTATRRAIFGGVGAVGAAALLAACGDDATPTPTSTKPAAQVAGPLGKKSDIPVNGGVIYAERGVVVTQPTAGEFKGFSSVCTHQSCPVANISNGQINCTCHNSAFSIVDGSVKSPPATMPLPSVKLKIEGDEISLA